MPAAGDRERFHRLSGEFESVLRSLKTASHGGFVRKDWAERNRELERFLLPVPPADFLRHPAILFQMFVDGRYLAPELPYVMARLPAASLAAEDAVGDPPTSELEGHEVVTSSNTVHHLHHLLSYEQEAGRRLGDHQRVVEWGGGYGNLAKLFTRLHPATPTYVLIDTPTFSAVQWLYLSSVLGDDRVLVHSVASTPIAEGKINIVPVGLVDKLSQFPADLFISTWALNECTEEAQRYVVERNWFGAGGLLLAMHKGDPFEKQAVAAGCRELPVGDFMPPQRYFIR